MAKATSATKKVEKTIIEEQKVYTLELTESEAHALVALTGSTGGSAGGDTGKIYNELRNAGVPLFGNVYRVTSGTIHLVRY